MTKAERTLKAATAISSFKQLLENMGPGLGGRSRSIAITHAETALLWAEKGIAEAEAP